jgi:hypothetical protein
MIPLTITPDLDRAPWTDLQSDEPEVGLLSRIGLLRHGTEGGKATVGLVVTLPDGQQVLAQTTWALFRMAYTALAASPVASEEVLDP